MYPTPILVIADRTMFLTFRSTTTAGSPGLGIWSANQLVSTDPITADKITGGMAMII